MTRYICYIYLLLLLFLGSITSIEAHVNTSVYGDSILVDTMQIAKQNAHYRDSIYGNTSKSANMIYQVERHSKATSSTTDFYLIMGLVLLLSFIRYTSPQYFNMLLRTFRNPSGSRHARELMQNSGLPNLLMNLFFCLSISMFIYYTGKALGGRMGSVIHGEWGLLLVFIGIVIMYLAKYLGVQFTGWVFGLKGITDEYNFNVFLVNKIIGIVLLPLILMIAFAGTAWVKPIIIISMLAVGIMLISRYLRSWNAFGNFFQYSRFHFFVYLCASEILPLAILMKLLLRTII